MEYDGKRNKDNVYEYASLKKQNLPSSFTVCTVFMTERWTKDLRGLLFVLLDDKGEIWLWVVFSPFKNYTQFWFQFKDLPMFSTKSDQMYFPLQWTRVCLSIDANTSVVRLVVDGDQLMEQVLQLNKKPENLNLVLGSLFYEVTPGKVTNLNVFSSALPVEQMKMKTSAGEEICELEGDFLSWEESLENYQWTLYSKSRWVEMDPELESPCKANQKLICSQWSKSTHIVTVCSIAKSLVVDRLQ